MAKEKGDHATVFARTRSDSKLERLRRFMDRLIATDAVDRHTQTLCTMAGDPKTPAPVLDMLARIDNNNVRVALANNSKLPDRLFAILLADTDETVLEAVITNPCIPLYILQGVSRHHPCPDMRELAQSVLATEVPEGQEEECPQPLYP